MRIKTLIVGGLLSILLLTMIGSAEFFTVFGHVTDGNSGSPVNGAIVTLTINGVTQTTVTAINNLGVGGSYAFQLANFPNVQSGTTIALSAKKDAKSASVTVPRAATSPQSVDLTLTSPVLFSITIPPAESVFEGTTSSFTGDTRDQFGNPIAATLTWSSSNKDIVTIDRNTGVFTALGPGTVTITAASGSVTGTSEVTVLEESAIKISPTGASLVVGSTQIFTAQPLDQFGNPISVPVTWNSNNNTVGSIDPDTGFFTAAKAGTTIISATGDTTSGTATVTVANSGPDVCANSRRTIHYDVAAIDVAIPINGWGDFNPQGMIYALNNPKSIPNVEQIKDTDFKLYDTTDMTLPDKIQPLTLRANVGDCIEVTLTNRLDTASETINPQTGKPIIDIVNQRTVGMQVEGLPYDPLISDGAFIGKNPDTTVAPGQNKTYRWYANRTGGYLFRDQTNAQFPEDTINKGLFGMVIVEQEDSVWFDSQTGRNFLLANPQVGYNLTDLIQQGTDPNTHKPVYLGVGASIFASVHQLPGKPLPGGTLLWENVSGNDYRTYALMMSDEMEGLVSPVAWNEDGSIAAYGKAFFPATGLQDSTKFMNYRSEPLRNREGAWDRHRGMIPVPEIINPITHSKVAGGLVNGTENTVFTNKSLGVPFVDIPLPLDEVIGAQDTAAKNRILTLNASNMTVTLPDGRKFLPGDNFCKGGNFSADNARAGDPLYMFYPCQGEESHLQSWPFGDPAPALPRAYWGDPVIYYAATAGNKETHTFHQHTHRWFHDPDQVDINKLPLPENPIQISNRLDVQGISPGEVFKIVFEQGAGSQAGTAGDSIFHCHLYPHFAEGLWSAIRVFDRFRMNFTDPSNINSNMLNRTSGRYEPLSYPDGTQEAQLVPLPAKMALFDTRVPGTIDKRVPAPRGMPNRTATPPDADHPGYPNFIAGKFGLKALQPPRFIIDLNTSLPVKDRAIPTKLEINASYDGISPGTMLIDPCAGPNHEFGNPASGKFGPPRKPDRIYEPVAIQVPLIQNSKGFFNPEQRAYVEKELVDAVRKDPGLLKPYSWRANVGDCVEFHATNDLQPNDKTPTLGTHDGIFHGATNTPEISNHIHIIRFDQLGSDGTSVNWNYDISARAGETVGYRILVDINGRTIFNHDHQFPTSHQQGGMYAAFINEPKNSSYFKPDGTPLGPTVANNITYNLTSKKYTREQMKGVGVAAFINVTNVTGDATGGISGGNLSAFREFIVQYSDYTPSFTADPAALNTAFNAYKKGNLNSFFSLPRDKPFNPPSEPDFYGEDQGVNTMNYRIEPFQTRINLSSPNLTQRDPAYVFSSRVWGDPQTEVFRAYMNDPVVVRVMDGAHEDHHTFEMHGQRWLHQAADPDSFLTDNQASNIGEWFNYELQGNANKTAPGKFKGDGGILIAGLPGDYLFGSLAIQEAWDGNWGIFRVENGPKAQGLAPLPNNPKPQNVPGLGLLGQNVAAGNVPQVDSNLTKNNNPCPAGAPVKHFDIVAIQNFTMYNDVYRDNDPFALMYVLAKDEKAALSGAKQPEPLVIRANQGDCVEVNLTNHLPNLTSLAAGTPVKFFEVPDEFKTPVLVNSPTSLDPNTLQHYGDAQMDTIVTGRPIGGTQIGQNKSQLNAVFVKWPISQRVSMHPHLVKEVAAVGDGATVGFMRDQTIGPGQNITYEWYADKELGATLLDDYGDLRSHRHHGLSGVLVIEPKGSRYLNPTDMSKEITTGTSAVIENITTGKQFREFVPLFMDAINLRNASDFLIPDNEGTPLPVDHQPCSPSVFCEDVEDQGEYGINYRTEMLSNRVPQELTPLIVGHAGIFGGHGGQTTSEELFSPDAFKAFSSMEFHDPATPVFETFVKDPVVFRPLRSGDQRRVVNIGIQGHSWKHEPNDPVTNIVNSEGSFGVGKSFNFYLIGGAGGQQHEPGDYLYNDRLNAPEGKHFGGGYWGLIRVYPEGAIANIKPLTNPAVLPQSQP